MVEELLRTEVCFVGVARGEFEKAAKNYIETHGGVTLVDIVKFLYQSVLGTHHILEHMNDKQIETWIKEQLESAEPADRPLTEPLFGNTWVRLDLGAFKHEYGDNYTLAIRMFLNGRSVEKARNNEFTRTIERLNKLLSNRKIRPTYSQIDISIPAKHFIKTYKQKGFPPLHHSASYAKQNPPYIIIPSKNPALAMTCTPIPAIDKRRHRQPGLLTANKNKPKTAKTTKNKTCSTLTALHRVSALACS
jgi:hypothetical protein